MKTYQAQPHKETYKNLYGLERRARISDTFKSTINIGGSIDNPYYRKYSKRFMSP